MKFLILKYIIYPILKYENEGYTMNFLNTLKSLKKRIVTLYTAGTKASYAAIAVTSVVTITAVAVVSIAIISNVTNADEIPTTSYVETSISEMEETTTEPTTTEPPTSTTLPPETTTAEESTTPEETTTPAETTTQPETIAVEDLNIGNIEDASEEFVDKGSLNEFEAEPETPAPTTTQTPTTKPATQPTTEKITEPETNPPVSEYACVVKGIDISKWNSQGKPSIDWAKVKASGVKFVIIRAGFRGQTSAELYEDPYFKEHIEGALSAGLQVGVYFYSQAITEKEALEEASYLLSLIKDYKITYPVCFDWEPVSGSRAGEAKLTKAQATAVAKKFLSTIEGYGYDAMLYSYHAAIKQYFNMSQLEDYKTWLAYYYSKYKYTGVEYAVGDPLPEESYPYQMWQYSSTGTVPGISGYVDMNVAFFSYSGSGVPNSAIVLNLPATSYTTNLGVSVDFKSGVVAYNTAGLNVSSDVTTTIKDSSGNTVTEKNVFNTAGTYTITYTIKDFTGVSKSATAKLTVRSNPSFTFNENELTFYRKDSTQEDIINAVKNNLVSVKDSEGKSLDLSTVKITGLEGIYSETSTEATENTTGETTADSSSETTTNSTSDTSTGDTSTSDTSTDSTSTDATTDTSSSETTSSEETTSQVTNGLVLGKYIVTFTVTDDKGATGTATITVNIVD